MREFNTSGPNNPDIHFTVMREAQLQQALEQITRPADPKGGRYFTLYAPRQTGKTTFVEQLMKRMDRQQFFPAMISFEALANADEPIFYREFAKLLDRRGNFPFPIPEMSNKYDLIDFFAALKTKLPQKLCLIIDEFDGLNAPYIGDLLHLFRDIYQARDKKYNLHSLILIGVRNLTEVNLEHASPFNTNDEIRLSFFAREETFDLMAQYEAESGQLFAPEVKERIYYETQGQPGLVSALCKKIVEDLNPGTGKMIGPEIADEAVERFIRVDISKNVANIVNKARQVEEHILELFTTSKKIDFNIDEEWQKFLWVHGVIEVEDSGGKEKFIKFSCPLYQKKLYFAFKPRIDEMRYYVPIGVSYKSFLFADGTLNVLALLQAYQAYVNRRGKKAFAHARKRKDGRCVEAAYHYSLDTFLSAAMPYLNGQSHVEFPTGNGKVDIFIFHQSHKYILEVKNFANADQFKKAKEQAARYAQSEGLREVYLVVFSEVHPRDKLNEAFEENIEDVAVKGVLINVNFDRPKSSKKRRLSSRRVPPQRRAAR
jgi:hypothetical protein